MSKEIGEVVSVIDKAPLESKKFMALLVGVAALLSIVLIQRGLKSDATVAIHAMDVLFTLLSVYIAGQGLQDVVRAIKGQ